MGDRNYKCRDNDDYDDDYDDYDRRERRRREIERRQLRRRDRWEPENIVDVEDDY